ncbi:cation diffusion facilitator family transporter [Luteimonas cucumeris]|uniref:Cation diffusion facilitator family transporter n=1 Tax=Luteimonas cucumeris TaxID=985012 RepID=A0A562KY43_9GAMM|nr:cation transporter [Luteimonas cucumeris]TWI00342.1 cation diffusion facilitator family transporter [Luteimonas cucumeris]
MDTTREQALLKFSIRVTMLVCIIAITAGVVSGSQAIIFDGIYSLLDVVLTLLSLAVSRLVASEGSHRFQYGYWHLEPMVEALGSAILSLICIYAVINAARTLLAGGSEISFGMGALWIGVISAIDFAMAIYIRRQARTMESGLLDLDARAWLLTGLLSVAVFISFLFALLLDGVGYAHLTRFVDPLVLLVVGIGMLPSPLRAAWRAMREVLQVAPDELDRQVQQVMAAFVAQHGFLGFTSHVAKVGRARFVEVHVLTAPDYSPGTIGEVDRMRDGIADQLDAHVPQFWLTIDFTADPDWT